MNVTDSRAAPLAVIVAVLTAYRLWVIGHLGIDLYVDEAYYWGWSRALDWGYFSKPPVIAALIAASTRLLGDSIIAIKLPSLLLYPATAFALIAREGVTITGLVPAKSGSITYDGHDLLKTHANKIVTLGMAHVPEGRHVFTRMSVQENLEMGAFSLKDQSSLGKDLEMVFDYFPRLKERRRQLSGTLSGGEQQMVAMGRALMSHPKTILMDEPSMGLSPLLVKEIFDIIVTLRKRGITVLLVEQNAKMALSIADRAYVLETGKITMEGKASDLLHDEKVRKAYLGA